MKIKFNRFWLIFFLIACNSEENEPRCASCILDENNKFDICELENGNAALNGSDTSMDYDEFIYEFELVGYTCQ